MVITPNLISNLFFFLSLFFFLYLTYLIFEPFLDILFLSFFVAVILYPVYSFLHKKLSSDIIAAFVSTFIVLIFIIIPSVGLFLVFTNQVIELYPVLVKNLSKFDSLEGLLAGIPFAKPVIDTLNQLQQRFNFSLDLGSLLKQFLSFLVNFLIAEGKAVFINFTLVVVGILFMLMTVFFLFKDGEKLYHRVYNLIPLPDRDKMYIIRSTYNAIQGVVLGSVFTAIAQGILSFIGYYFAGVNYALFWAILTFFAAFIPIGGASLVWVPIAIYLFFAKGWLVGLLFTLWGTFVISTVDNIIKPIVIGEKTNIHPLIFIFAILGGLKAFGFLGIFIAPIVIVILDNLLNIYRERYLHSV